MTAYRRWILLCLSLLLLPAFTPQAQQASAVLPAAPTGLQVIIRLPPAAPVVNITVPTSASTYDAGTATTVALAGTATTLSSITGCTWINSLGGSGAAVGGIAWSIASVALTIGSNVVTVTCTDINGQTGTDVLTVTRSTPAGPTVTITTPTASPTFDAGTSSSLTVAGTGAANTPATITSCTWINSLGGSGAASGTTSWSVASLPLTVGSNVVTATCTDSFSQTANDVITITRSAGGGGGANPIAAARLPGGDTTIPNLNWAAGGATIINRGTQCVTSQCNTVSGGSVTPATVNAAITSAPTDSYVGIPAGTFSMNGGIIMKSNITLRGAGANATFLNFTGATSSCAGWGAAICVGGSQNYANGGEANIVSWTAGYAQGSTVLTLSSTAAITAGSTVLMLDQLNDSNSDPGLNAVWVCETPNVCTVEGSSGAGRNGRMQEQLVRVVSKTATTVTVTPGLYMSNWRSSQSPQAWFADTTIEGVGIESLSLNYAPGGSGIFNGITFASAYNSWAKGVRGIKAWRANVFFYDAAHITVRDSYFFDTGQQSSTSYGMEHYPSSDNRVENNVFQRIVTPNMLNGSNIGLVAAYNYMIDDFFVDNPAVVFAGLQTHGAGTQMALLEGNDGPEMNVDYIHGTAQFITLLRNRLDGRDTPARTTDLRAFNNEAYSRFQNVLGNVLGTSGLHSNYESNLTYTPASIYDLGRGCDSSCAVGASLAPDALVRTTLFRWGNYDTVTGTIRWVASEAPSGIGTFANPVPGAQTVPVSYYLSAKPSFFKASDPWPPIGPDVTGGTIANVGGHAYKIPARQCFETLMGGVGGETTARPFPCTYPLP